MIRGLERDLLVLLILMNLRVLDIHFSKEFNQWIINQIHRVIMDTWKLFFIKMAIPSSFLQICRAEFLFEYLIMEFGIAGNKCKQHSIKNKSYFNEIKRMGAGPHPSVLSHVTKEL